MISVYSSMIYVAVIATSLIFTVNFASAHIVPGFSIQPDLNYTDPVTHNLDTKEGRPHIVLTQNSTFVLPMTLKSANGSLMTSYSFLVTNDTDFTSELTSPGISIHVVPDHFIVRDGVDKKFNIVIKVDKNAPSGVYKPNLATSWDNNVTKSMYITSISFQVGKWNWDSLSSQVEAGISAQHVVCKSNFQIVIIKAEDGSPACVTPDTAQKLIERGWAESITSEISQTSATAKEKKIVNAASEKDTISPALVPLPSCGMGVSYSSSSKIINYTGFLGVYHNVIPYFSKPDDYVLEPGHSGNITYVIDAGSRPVTNTNLTSLTQEKEFNVTNYAIFYHQITTLSELVKHTGVTINDNHDYKVCFTRPTGVQTCTGGPINGDNPVNAYVTDHPGIRMNFEPQTELLQFNYSLPNVKSTQIVTMTISADQNAPRGTYTVFLSPEVCLGGKILFVTIGNEPYHD